MIRYDELQTFDMNAITPLYKSVEWFSYTQDSTQLERALKNSLYIYSAWDKNELIGLIRVVGDGETIIYIQDILVHPRYQGQRIGTNLINHIISKYDTVRQKVLITDDTEKTKRFYRSVGFLESTYLGFVCYYHKQR